MRGVRAHAKINLALVVGPLRPDGKHEVVTVLQRVELYDELSLAAARSLSVTGFADDTLVREALVRLAAAARSEPAWEVRIEKRIPVAAGLGGGSSDAAAALRLANESLPTPLADAELHQLAAGIGADVPFFLREGPQLGTGDGTDLTPLDLPLDYWAVLVLPGGEEKPSTAAVYRRFDGRGGARGFEGRRAALLETLATVRRSADLAVLPGNDLAHSALSARLLAEGAFRADVSGAGPAVFGLFLERGAAAVAREALADAGRTWLVAPAW